MLLLRTALGVTALVQGFLYFGDHGSPWALIVGAGAAIAGVLLILGFLTPVMSAVVGLGTAGLSLSWLPAPHSNLFNSPLPAFLFLVVAAALILLGPGSSSVDARLFGRREIIIPHRVRS